MLEGSEMTVYRPQQVSGIVKAFRLPQRMIIFFETSFVLSPARSSDRQPC